MFLFCSGVTQFSKIIIKNLPLNIEDAKLIQAILKPHLTSVSFENFPFVFDNTIEFHFNFSSLEKLTRFQYSNCFKYEDDRLMSMIETISSKLVHLDISKNHMHSRNQSRLMKFLMLQTELVILKVSDNYYDNKLPKVTGEILGLKKLEELYLNRNVDLESFVEKLTQIVEPLNLKKLELFNYFHENYLESFFSDFDKLSNLTHLGITGIYAFDIVPFLINNIDKLENLEEIMFDYPIEVQDLGVLLEKLNVRTKITSKYLYFAPLIGKQLQFFKNFDLWRLDINTISTIEDNWNFDGITDLKFNLTTYSRQSSINCGKFFGKFKKLKTLKADVGRNLNMNILTQLLENNYIENIEISFQCSFSQFDEIWIEKL